MVLLDTNILIYHLNGALTPEVRGKIHAWVEDGAAISVISRIEVLGFRQAEEDMATAERLLGVFVEVPLSEEVVRGTILLRQERRISVPNAIIAASALRMEASLTCLSGPLEPTRGTSTRVEYGKYDDFVCSDGE